MSFDKLSKILFSGYNLNTSYEDSFYLVNVDYKLVNNFIIFLKKHSLFKFDTLYDLNTFINSGSSLNSNKFTIYYYLFSLKYNSRVIVSTQIKSEKNYLLSLSNIFKSSAWLEREV
jgi:NADH:ubiquinone oxidoreductase subunit C